MSRLNELASQAIIETDLATGERDIRRAASRVVDQADADEVKALAFEGARRLCAKLARSIGPTAERSKRIAGQTELFPELWQSYAIDAAGTTTKLTGNLSQVEFRRIIAMREKQIDDDARHLRFLREAYRTVAPIWDNNPDWSFGQCCADYARRRAAA